MAHPIALARVLFCAMILAFAGLAVQQSMAAATVQVGTCLTGIPHYTTIQSAVNASAPGTTIRVCPGNYPEQVVINKTLALNGVQSETGRVPVVTPPAVGIVQNAAGLGSSSLIGAQILVQNATGVNIAGLAVDGSGNLLSCTLDFMGIYYQNASGTINYVVTRNQNLGSGSECQSGEGIFAQSGYGYSGSSAVVIENSNVYAYQKNGISADGNTLTVTITSNDVIGQGSDPYVAQNGIQITGGTRGTILNNSVLNDIYTGATFSATGILVDSSSGLSLSNNTVGNTQGIVIFSGGTAGSADQTSLISNRVLDTDTYDGIDVCSNNNTVVSNTVMGSNQGGIHLDDSCGEPNGSASGNNNTVTKNSINNVCAGLLLGSGTGNTVSPNSIFNADYVNLAGDSCTAAGVTASASAQLAKRRPRVSPVRP
ncbi:MAG TPA: right-handed parallel beta-helix repeat-containing protein [Candidatus Sulfotelmatobacter sp.]